METRDFYIEKLQELEDKTKDGQIHQIMIDLIQEAIIDLEDPELKIDYTTLLGAIRYEIMNLEEVIDKSLKDYELLLELKTLFDA